MRSISLSITKGTGNIKHNTRTQVIAPKNVDTLRSSQNIQLVHEPIEQVYNELFSESLEQYNAKQTRSDRKIKNYYKKIVHDKKTKPFHELVVQIGNREQQLLPRQTNAIYSEFVEQFKQANPQLKVIGAYIHNDEATPHMHLDYVPVANYKRGLSKRVANNKAIEQMGYSSWNDWKDKQNSILESILEKNGYNRQIMNNSNRHIADVDQFKRVQQEVERQANAILQTKTAPELPEPRISVNHITKKETIKLDPDEFRQIRALVHHQKLEITSLEAQKSTLEAQNDFLVQKLDQTKNKPYIALNERLKAENQQNHELLIQKNNKITSLASENRELRHDLDQLQEKYNGLVSKHNKMVKTSQENEQNAEKYKSKYEEMTLVSSYIMVFLDYVVTGLLSKFMNIKPLQNNIKFFFNRQFNINPDLKSSYDSVLEMYKFDKDVGFYEQEIPDVDFFLQSKQREIEPEPIERETRDRGWSR